MTPNRPRHASISVALVLLACACVVASAARLRAASPPAAAGPALIQPAELVSVLKATTGPKPLVIQVGFRILYLQAHIPGSEYIGPASSPEGMAMLRKRVQTLPRTQAIVIYCGCCPWVQCPTVNPAYDALRGMGFTNVKILYIARNFGVEWVQMGYPVARGQ